MHNTVRREIVYFVLDPELSQSFRDSRFNGIYRKIGLLLVPQIFNVNVNARTTSLRWLGSRACDFDAIYSFLGVRKIQYISSEIL